MKLFIMMFLVLLTGCFFSYPSPEIQEQLATNAAIDLITKHLEDEYARLYTYLGPIKVNSIKLSDSNIKITKEKSVKILIDNEETKAWPIIADLDTVAFVDYTENKDLAYEKQKNSKFKCKISLSIYIFKDKSGNYLQKPHSNPLDKTNIWGHVTLNKVITSYITSLDKQSGTRENFTIELNNSVKLKNGVAIKPISYTDRVENFLNEENGTAITLEILSPDNQRTTLWLLKNPSLSSFLYQSGYLKQTYGDIEFVLDRVDD